MSEQSKDLKKCVDELKLLRGLPPYDYPNPTTGDNYAGHFFEKKYTEETKKEAKRIVDIFEQKVKEAIRGVK